jgi:predicted dienelactone hydrolase
MATLAGLETAPDQLWPPTADPRVDAAVVLAGDAIMFGPTGLAEITIPLMTIGGTADTGSPFAWGTGMAYEHTSSARKAEVSLDGAEHFVFVGPCESVRGVLRVVPNYFCADSGWDRQQAQVAINHYTTAFLLAELNENTSADSALADRTPVAPGVSLRQQGYPTSTASPGDAAHRSEGE